MAFLLDGSPSVKSLSSSAALKYKNLVTTVINFYSIGKNETNVGIVVFSSYSTTTFTFDSHYSKLDINTEIDAMTYPLNGSNIGVGLTTVRTELFGNARLGVPNCLIVVTDGVSTDDISMPSAYLNAMKVFTIAVGVGDYYAKEELNELATRPSSSSVFETPSFDDLPATATKLNEAICEGIHN